MPNKLKYGLFTLLLMVSAISCGDKDLMEFTDWPIIEAYLDPGKCFSIRISRRVPFSDDVEYSSDNIDSLEVMISYGDTSFILSASGDGYYTDSTLIVTEGDEYYLALNFNNKAVSAYTYIPSKPANFEQSGTSIEIERMDSTSTGFPSGSGSMPDPISLTWDNEDQSYYLVVVENLEDSLIAIRDFGDEDPPDNISRKSPNTSTSEELRPNDFQYFGTHRIILFHVLPDYAALYEQSSNSSQNLNNPSTSIVNGYGIFTGMNSDTLFVEVIED